MKFLVLIALVVGIVLLASCAKQEQVNRSCFIVEDMMRCIELRN